MDRIFSERKALCNGHNVRLFINFYLSTQRPTIARVVVELRSSTFESLAAVTKPKSSLKIGSFGGGEERE